jgi:Fe-S-cluster-containing dehydrogenase component
MNRFALTIAEEQCWGCQTCELACKQENGAPEGVKLIRVGEHGPRQIDGQWHYTFTVNRCRHCEDPPCVGACPDDAIAKREDGIVVLDRGACSGCRSCQEACPYDAIDFDETHNVARKCNLCHHRVHRGLLPACADNVCLAHCIHLSVETTASQP